MAAACAVLAEASLDSGASCRGKMCCCATSLARGLATVGSTRARARALGRTVPAPTLVPAPVLADNRFGVLGGGDDGGEDSANSVAVLPSRCCCCCCLLLLLLLLCLWGFAC